MWDLIVSDPDHCLSFYFVTMSPRGLRNSRDFSFPRGKTQ